MMMPENTWRKVRVQSDRATNERTVVLSAVFAGVRVWCEKVWSAPRPADGERSLLHERFWTTNPNHVHRTAQAALEEHGKPVPA